MSHSGDFARLREIFGAVVGLPAAERAAALRRLCGDDAALRRAVEEMLEADRRSPAFLDGDAADLAARDLASLLQGEDLAGLELGPWRVLEEIGRGGMGRVFLVERSDGVYEQRAAMKVLERFLGDAREAERRFDAERRILAQLDHPGIARVLDGGVSEGGVPYLVMEYVDGTTLDVHCREQGLGLEQRLRLFRDVCAAVEHAHGRLIVHRDLKPGNILVDGDGRIRLVDFGIAKMLDAPAPSMTATRTGMLVATPQYAAPEQLRLEPVTVATDVYALGVVLYELVAGRPPYDLAGRPASEVERLVCEEEPPPPSRSAGEADGDAPDRGTRSGVGDLDLIVLEAMRKDPARRYASVAELADDVDRFLARRPIRARPPTAGYRLRRFVARHPLGVALAAVAAAVLVLFVTALANQREEALRQRDLARAEAEESEEVQQFLVGLFEASDPRQTVGEEPAVGDLLERARERIAAMDDRPLVQAGMLLAIARAHSGLGDEEMARNLLEQARTVQVAQRGEAHRAVAEIDTELANVLMRDQRFEEAVERLRSSRGIYARVLDPEVPEEAVELAEQELNLGVALRFAGELDEAIDHLQCGHDRLMELDATPMETKALAAASLSQARFSLGDTEAALALAEEALRLRLRAHPKDHPEVATAAINVGYLQRTLGDLEAAEANIRSGLEKRERVLGPEHPQTLSARHHLAVVLSNQGRFDEAERAYREILDAQRRLHGEQHQAVIGTLSSLAALEERRGRFERALELRRDSLARYREVMGDEHWSTVDELGMMALVLLELGRHEEAEAAATEGIARERAIYGADHALVSASLMTIAEARIGQGDGEGAEEAARQALEMRRRHPEDHLRIGTALRVLGTVLRGRGRIDAALEVLEESVDLLERSGAERWLAISRHELARTLAASGRTGDARREFEGALEILRRVMGPRHPRTLAAEAELAELTN